eukprot:CAMPEP_0202918702 /NCGR_PEP_ID=MMETSP1392-20130828/74087_1 /ASSEMBLY_ACC=CAM_ASM_000868 /TAXON_ID=225041 /ORGANISM="Chlamydomonas chlamydogama, Strain SAG 11-48b" /LENGTH=128 /DNA_ID=CAMNT_0049611837 /DNA_START=467 /DNA_END=854 /DNA_ORIENTATION=+
MEPASHLVLPAAAAEVAAPGHAAPLGVPHAPPPSPTSPAPHGGPQVEPRCCAAGHAEHPARGRLAAAQQAAARPGVQVLLVGAAQQPPQPAIDAGTAPAAGVEAAVHHEGDVRRGQHHAYEVPLAPEV